MAEKYRWSKDVEVVSMENEWMVLHAENHTVTRLNEVGGEVWTALKEPTGVDDIVAAILSEYDVSEEQARADVVAFIQQLKESGLVELVG